MSSRAVQLFPEIHQAWYQIGLSLFSLSRFAEAMEVFAHVSSSRTGSDFENYLHFNRISAHMLASLYPKSELDKLPALFCLVRCHQTLA